MKFSTLLTIFIFCLISVADAQLREDLYNGSDYSGVVTYEQQSSSPGNWMNMLNMTMNHSYSMTFSSFGGQMQNLNAYTNSMMFDISNNLNAQVDVSFLHSPFGNSFSGNNSGLGSQVIVERARLDYKLSESTHISLEFSQRPYGFSPFSNSGYGFNRGYNSPFNRYNGW